MEELATETSWVWVWQSRPDSVVRRVMSPVLSVAVTVMFWIEPRLLKEYSWLLCSSWVTLPGAGTSWGRSSTSVTLTVTAVGVAAMGVALGYRTPWAVSV